MKRALGFAMVALLPGHWVYAQDTSGSAEQFKENCKFVAQTNRKLEDAFRGGVCSGYFMGFLEAYELTPPAARAICFPKGVTVFQMAAVYTSWAEKNPAKWHEDRVSTVWVALREAFPCQPNK
jgi:hypothetical protein